MRRRKLQKKCNSENATLEVAFFRIFRCICFGAVAFLFAFFRFFFVKKIQKLIKVAKNATEKMQRRKLQKKCNGENATLEVAFFLHFPFVIFGICIFRCIFRFSGFATTSLVVLLGVLTAAYVAYRRRHSDQSWCQRHIAQELPGSLHVSLSFGQFQNQRRQT